MIEMICASKPDNKPKTTGAAERPHPDAGREAKAPPPRAVVPTVDLYSARVLFSLTQKMLEDTVDRRISLLEKRIEERDREVLRTIRKIQTRLLVQQSKAREPWWRRLFK